MGSGSATLFAWSSGLAGATYTAFALYLWRAGQAGKSHAVASRWLLAAVAATALWGWSTLADQFASVLLFLRLGALADLLLYGCWFAFLLRLLTFPKAPAAIARLRAVSLAAIAGVVLLQSAAIVQVGGIDERSRLVPLGSMALPLLGLILLEQLLRNVDADALWSIKPLCLGLGGTFLFDLYLFSNAVLFNNSDSDAANIRGAARASMVPLLLLSTQRSKDWMARLRVSRQAVFHSATLLLAGAYLIFISGVGYYVRLFGGDWGRALQLGLVFIAVLLLLVLALSGSMRARLRVFVGKNFFQYRYDYREEWLRFTQTLSAQPSPQGMGQQVIRGLAAMLESPGGGLWMSGASGGPYRQVARWNMARCDEHEPETSALCAFMQRSGWVINLDEYRSIPRRYDGLSLPPWLQELAHAWLIVPLCIGDEMIGFVVLASARADVEVNWEVNDLLKTAGRQAASFLAQMRATEELLEARKFEAFNRMSAFVVHDLKNIVTQLSLMMKNAKRLHANPEFQQDMLMTIENSVEKMRQLMLQLREGATPPGTAFGVDLGRLAQRIESGAAHRGRTVSVTVVGRVFARGHEERLERVIGHVVQNALDATDPEGRVWLKVDRFGDRARIEVGDTGHGMSQDFIRDRLFKPFQTTKKAGMGIGAYESFQYVRELGGSVDVKSEPGLGTEVTVLLPLFEVQKEADFHLSNAS